MLVIVVLLFGAISMLAVMDFLFYLFYRERWMGTIILKCVEIFSVAVGPLIFVFTLDWGTINDCCSDSAFFSPSHRPVMYVLIFLCAAAYFYSSWRTQLFAPLVELLINCFLLIGLIINVLVSLHQSESYLWLLGNVPIIALFLTRLIKNNQMLADEMGSWHTPPNFLGKTCTTLLRANFFIKFPVLLILCLPLLILLSALLFVFGQQPDSVIKAFTDTYKHGLSQLDYMCDNVECGGHYLCSVAANGHAKIVKPQRYGERNGNKIICNRQLLISNAFEELIEQTLPCFHRVIRKHYDGVGNFVHRYYGLFSNKFFSDFIFYLMKPLEWLFLGVLYIADRYPEDRIAQQYLDKSDRTMIKEMFLKNKIK